MAEICAYQGDNAIHIRSIPGSAGRGVVRSWHDFVTAVIPPESRLVGGNAIARQANWE